VSVALVIEHEKYKRHVILSSVASLAVPYSTTVLKNGRIFGGKKMIEYKIRVVICYKKFF
jgi:hypothetical protein